MVARWWRSGSKITNITLASSSLASTSTSSSTKSASAHMIQAYPQRDARQARHGRHGRHARHRDKNSGRIPALVYTQSSLEISNEDPALNYIEDSFVVHRMQIADILTAVKLPFFFSTRFPIEVRPGKGSSVLLLSGHVLPVMFQKDEFTGYILSVHFVWANMGTVLKVKIPLVFTGDDICPGLTKGGSLKFLRNSLNYLCPAEHIPPMIEVDVSNLDIGDQILMHDVKVHTSLRLFSNDEEMPICKVVTTISENRSA